MSVSMASDSDMSRETSCELSGVPWMTWWCPVLRFCGTRTRVYLCPAFPLD